MSNQNLMFIEYLIVFIFGVLIGNFATPILYRLPRGIIVYGFNKEFTRPPFCSVCYHPLKFYEYLPILSWISTLGKCNYCKVHISYSYILLELSAGFAAILCLYLFRNNLDLYFIIFSFLVSSLIAIFIAYEHPVIPNTVTLSLIVEGIIYRTLSEKTVLSWLLSICIVSLLSLWLLNKREFLNPEKQSLIHVILPGGAWLTNEALLIYGIVVLFSLIIKKFFWQKLSIYGVSIAALIFIVLYINYINH